MSLYAASVRHNHKRDVQLHYRADFNKSLQVNALKTLNGIKLVNWQKVNE